MNKLQTFNDEINISVDHEDDDDDAITSGVRMSYIEGANRVQMVVTKRIPAGVAVVEAMLARKDIVQLQQLLNDFATMLPEEGVV